MTYCSRISEMIHLLLLWSLLHFAASIVHYAVPESHHNDSFSLNHYVRNVNKYFTSDSQLHLLPGEHYLTANLIIRNVSNLLLTGNKTDTTITTVITCSSQVGIVLIDCSHVVIANITMKECGGYFRLYRRRYIYETEYLTSLLIADSENISCLYFLSLSQKKRCGVTLINAFGHFSNLIADYLIIRYDSLITSPSHNTLSVFNFQSKKSFISLFSLLIEQYKISTNITVLIEQSNFSHNRAVLIQCQACSACSIIIINNCTFRATQSELFQDVADNSYLTEITDQLSESDIRVLWGIYSKYNWEEKLYVASIFYGYYVDCENRFQSNEILIINSEFAGYIKSNHLLRFVVEWSSDRTGVTDGGFSNLSIAISKCLFYKNSGIIQRIIDVHQAKLHIATVKFSNIQTENFFHVSIIHVYQGSLTFSGYNEISNVSTGYALKAPMVYIQENSVINVTSNTFFQGLMFSKELSLKLDSKSIRQCPFQYLSERGNLDEEFQMGQELNYSIIIKSNNVTVLFNVNLIHCSWSPSAAFLTTRPLLVNHRFIHSDQVDKPTVRAICLCNTENKQDCLTDEISPSYAGQTLQLGFSLNKNLTFPNLKTAHIQAAVDAETACKIDKLTIIKLTSEQTSCQMINYTIRHKTGAWCELCLAVDPSISSTSAIPLSPAFASWRELITVVFKPCPKGFSLHQEGYCHCDPNLLALVPSITLCNIDDQTIPRPANSWIFAHTVNNISHFYSVSLHCPFDYCIPHSVKLDLTFPNSQCQYRRCGVLCGHCQPGLSAVFGSSACKHCSNTFLWLIIPIGIAGLMLVLLLFILNLTVADGNVNSFLLAVNIISINSSIFFPEKQSIVYTFISLANLDLGIETCFYDGMDEYVKMWLQLAFPLYLILIATLIIMASRYSTKVQRLTASRGLAVLATLFLLSYTKVLVTISQALFAYSTIAHMPNSHSEWAWSVDANVPLFGVKFTLLFVVCLVLFLLLLPYNIVLVFPRILSRFKVINYFKPILDSYQGPYKDTFHFWTGLQLLIRVILFAVSTLNRDTRMMISIVLLAVIMCAQKVFPFKEKLNNILEMISLLYLLLLFVFGHFMSTNDLVINIIASCTILQLFCIVIWHIYCLFLRKLHVTERMLAFFIKKEENTNRQIELTNAAPEVKYNYKEFREPLIGHN